MSETRRYAGADFASAYRPLARPHAGDNDGKEPVGAENRAALCDLGMLADQPAEPVPQQNPGIWALSKSPQARRPAQYCRAAIPRNRAGLYQQTAKTNQREKETRSDDGS